MTVQDRGMPAAGIVSSPVCMKPRASGENPGMNTFRPLLLKQLYGPAVFIGCSLLPSATRSHRHGVFTGAVQRPGKTEGQLVLTSIGLLPPIALYSAFPIDPESPSLGRQRIEPAGDPTAGKGELTSASIQ